VEGLDTSLGHEVIWHRFDVRTDSMKPGTDRTNRGNVTKEGFFTLLKWDA